VAAVAALLLVIGVLGWIVGVNAGAISPPRGIGYPSFRSAPNGRAVPPVQARPVTTVVKARSVRILDPQGDGTELRGAGAAADGDPATTWRTDVYRTARFGNLKTGMGVLLDLGSAQQIRSATVTMGQPGASVELRETNTASDDPQSYTTVANRSGAGTTVSLVPTGGSTGRYWLLWITQLPAADGGYRADVAEITLRR
jgi:hypothetical protein